LPIRRCPTTVEVACREIDALGNGAVDLLLMKPHYFRRGDGGAKNPKHWSGVKAARNHGRNDFRTMRAVIS
jgi:hypothetical protein